MLMKPPTLPADHVNAPSYEDLVNALGQIRHATAPKPDDGGHHEAAHDLADTVLKRVEARRLYESKHFSTAASTVQQKTLTLADLERTAQMLRDQLPEPIGEWMRSQNKPPEIWRLVLPQNLRDEVQGPMFWPDYVVFSSAVRQPVFIARSVQLQL